ncbi:S8 family serine peptidase [Leifsonia sp. YIM 134122]|uniref:S8 family serine peptidase n=1 Tax=Leifsonia stereocauli TaxID=3134136 RepID=A0ABU9W5R4_9MICO
MTRRGIGVAVVLGGLLAGGLLVSPTVGVAPAVAADEVCKPGNVVFSTERPAAFSLLQTEAAWQRSTGEGVIVAVVDSGIDADNPHLEDAVVGGIDLVGDGERADGLSDPQGHGTAIAGQIAARKIPESGVVGLAPDAGLLSVRVFRGTDDESKRDGFGPTTARLAAGIRWAAEHDADVINVSLSEVDGSAELQAAVAAAHKAGSLVVASGGNRATAEDARDGARYPAAYPGVLGVTASDASGTVTDDSIHGPQVDVSAPAQSVTTSATGAGDCVYATEAPSSSFATGYVSGAAALVAAAHPADGPDGWAYRLMATAARTDPDQRDDVSGWGLIQPADAITLLPSATTRGPASPFVDTAGSAVRPPSISVTPSDGSSAFAATSAATAFITIVGATLLGIIATAVVLRRRRRADADSGASASDGPPRLGFLDRPADEEF